MARVINLLILASMLVACEQTPTKPDSEPADLSSVNDQAAKAYAENNLEEAEKQYAILTREAPGEAEPWFKLGNIYARTLRSELAITSYQEALVRDSQHVKAWHNLGIIQLREVDQTFSQLQDLLDDDDPLHQKSVNIRSAIEEFVK